MVIGSDYRNKRIVGSEFINKIVYFDRVENMSTTSILEYEKDSGNR
jgi:bifunctional ADP-heptose synthase (sugar kinase/adenylyltransferase)